MACRVYAMPLSAMKSGGYVASNGDGSLSHENDHDLALMVNEFLDEKNNSSGADSIYSSDSDSPLADLRVLLGKVSYIKLVTDPSESDLMPVVYSLVLGIDERELEASKSNPCSASCIKFLLVKLLKLYGYDAGVCTSKWQTSSQVPKVTYSGEYEYIDVVLNSDVGGTERLIVDVDFRSHFEIARAVDSYSRLMNRLPVIFVGSLTKLEQYLQLMAEAARCSMKEHSMPLPPWRSFEYLQAKWQSRFDRKSDPPESNRMRIDHKKCAEYFRRLRSSLRSEIESERKLIPFNRPKIVQEAEKRKCATF